MSKKQKDKEQNEKMALQLKLAMDCKTFNLVTETERTSYFHRMGQNIHYNTIKKRIKAVDSSDVLNQWLNQYAKIGFVSEHRNNIERVKKLIEPLMRMYLVETTKPDLIVDPKDTRDLSDEKKRHITNPDKNRYLILKISDRIDTFTRTLSEFNLGNPIIAAIKKQVDAAGQGIVKDSNVKQITN